MAESQPKAKRPIESDGPTQGAAKVARLEPLEPKIIKVFPPEKLCDVTMRVIDHEEWGDIRCSRMALWQACFDPKHPQGDDQPTALLDMLESENGTNVIWLKSDLFTDADEFVSAVSFLLGTDPSWSSMPPTTSLRQRLERQLNHLGSFRALKQLLARTWVDVQFDDMQLVIDRCMMYRRKDEISFLATKVAEKSHPIGKLPRELIPLMAPTWLAQASKFQAACKPLQLFLHSYRGRTKCSTRCEPGCEGNSDSDHHPEVPHFGQTSDGDYSHSAFDALGAVYTAFDVDDDDDFWDGVQNPVL